MKNLIKSDGGPYVINRFRDVSLGKSAGGLLVLGLLLTGISEAATSVMTDIEFYKSGHLEYSDSDVQGPADSASTYLQYTPGNAAVRSYATKSGILNVDAYAGQGGRIGGLAASSLDFPGMTGGETALSTAAWETTVTNTTTTAIHYRYIFHIYSPQVGITGTAGDYAGLSIKITLNDSQTLVSEFVEYDAQGLRHSDGFLYPSGPYAQEHEGLNYSVYTFNSLNLGADVGTFGPGEEFKLTYEMKAYANAAEADEFVFARIADPITNDNSPIIGMGDGITEDFRVVPEPSTTFLLGGALGALLLRRRVQ